MRFESSRRAARALALAFAACFGAAGSVHAADKAPGAIPAEDFFKHPAMKDAALSPSGRQMAVLLAGAKGRIVLGVVDLEDRSKSRVVAAAADGDVYRFQWVNDQRLIFGVYDLDSPIGIEVGAAWYAVGADGSNFRRLVKPYRAVREGGRITSRELEENHSFLRTLKDGSDDVIFRSHHWNARHESTGSTLVRLNTLTGVSQAITLGAPAGAGRWVVDTQGRPRAVVAYEGDVSRLYWRNLDKDAWELLDQSRRYEHRFSPLAVDADGSLLVNALRSDAANTQALFRYDIAKRKAEAQPLLGLAGFDFEGQLITNPAGAVLGAHYLSDAHGTAWFDAAWRRVQERVDQLLPATANRLDCARCDATVTRVLVRAASDRQAPAYWLYDLKADKLEPVGAERPWIEPKAMAERQFHRIKARDGLEIPLYVTQPRGKGPFPAVVLVHGGPIVRGGDWEWEAEAQFLASRGYLVIAPEFRGSAGFGEHHKRAGFRQWGLAMQDDLADAATWAVKQGLADGGRICIAGGSYGGYASLMGLVRHPELYRCAVNLAGVTDIELMYTLTESDSTEPWQRYGMPELIGDRVKDAAQLAATSPIQQAAKIRNPVLMAYGNADRRVPIAHGTRFRDAVAAHNSQVEWVVYSDEGHGLIQVKNNVDFWQRVERFLARHLQSPAAATAAARSSGG